MLPSLLVFLKLLATERVAACVCACVAMTVRYHAPNVTGVYPDVLDAVQRPGFDSRVRIAVTGVNFGTRCGASRAALL